VPTLGFTRADFDIFKLEGFDERMQQILGRVRPRLVRLGNDLAPELARKLHLEFFPHVARHARRTVNPPPETWAAFGPSPKGYKRYGYLALCISGFGIHARAVVKSEADNRVEMGRRLANQAAELTRSFKGTPVARYDRWNFERLPAPIPATDELWCDLAQGLAKKTGGLDLGFGWPVADALKVDRAEFVDAFRELEPLYRVLRSVA
jgi:uncharacterized protein YktB (UPF0637 family)